MTETTTISTWFPGFLVAKEKNLQRPALTVPGIFQLCYGLDYSADNVEIADAGVVHAKNSN